MASIPPRYRSVRSSRRATPVGAVYEVRNTAIAKPAPPADYKSPQARTAGQAAGRLRSRADPMGGSGFLAHAGT